MKKNFVCFLFFILLVPKAFSIDDNVKQNYNKYNNTNYGFYTIKDEQWIFNQQPKEILKTFSKEEKKKYKSHLFADKLFNKFQEQAIKDMLVPFDKRPFNYEYDRSTKEILKLKKIIKYNPEFWPAYTLIALNYNYINKPTEAIKYANIVEKNWYAPDVYDILAMSYAKIGKFDKAFDYKLKYIKGDELKYERERKKLMNYSDQWPSESDVLSLAEYANKSVNSNSLITDKNSLDYKRLKEGIEAANIVEKITSIHEHKIEAIKLKHSLYLKLGDKNSFLEAKKLASLEPNFNNYLMLSTYYNNDVKEVLRCYYKAKLYANNIENLNLINSYIASYEQRKIDIAVKKLNFYTKAPNWNEISAIKNRLGSSSYWSDRQDLFFKATNKCIQNYNGKNLSVCFNQINEDQEKLTNMLREDSFRQEQLAKQDEIIRQQQLQTLYASEVAFYQGQSAYHQSQSAYYQRKTYEESTKPKNYTIIPTGNTYQIHQY